MAEFTKYQRNVWKAEAVESIANTILSNIQCEKGDLEYYEKNIKEQLESLPDDCNEEDDWQVYGNRKTIGQIKEKISLWEQLLKYVDKEMAF